jgi:hypothetical protein
MDRAQALTLFHKTDEAHNALNIAETTLAQSQLAGRHAYLLPMQKSILQKTIQRAAVKSLLTP